MALLERFLRPARARKQLRAYAARRRDLDDWGIPAGRRRFCLFAEGLAGAIGRQCP